MPLGELMFPSISYIAKTNGDKVSQYTVEFLKYVSAELVTKVSYTF